MNGDSLRVNPWFTMWTRPRATVRNIIERGSRFWYGWPVMLAGAAGILDKACLKNAGDVFPWFPWFLVAAVVAGLLAVPYQWYIGAPLIRWAGGVIGGRGSLSDVRTAVVWSTVPAAWLSVLWVPELVLFRGELFTEQTPRIEGSLLLIGLLILFGILDIVGGVWMFVVHLKCVGEALSLSAFKVLLAYLLLVVAVFLVLFIPGSLTLLFIKLMG